MTETQQMALDLVLILHRSMDWEVWRPKILKYWSVLQEAVAASAYTNNLAAWLNSVCSQMSITTPGATADDRARLEAILNAGEDRAVLRCLRTETQFIVVSARVATEARRAEYRARQEQEGEDA